MFQGRVSVADIIGFSSSEMISSKPDGEFPVAYYYFLGLV